MSFQLTEDEALPDATRVFTASAPAAGTLAAILIEEYTPNFTLVTSVQIGGVEQLPHNFLADALHTAQQNASLTYGAVAQNAVIRVHVVGDLDGVRATIT